MKKKHCIKDDSWTTEDVAFMANLGFQVKENEYIRLNLDENEAYKLIRDRFASRWDSINDFVYFEYSKEEILSSDYCVLPAIGGGGYPQPDGEFEWLTDVYDMSKYCWECGTPLVQLNDFKINKVSNRPLWGFTAWIHDILFTTEVFYKEVFEPLGIGCRTVRKGFGKIYSGVLQLDIPVIDENLDLSMQENKEYCPVCGRIKYGAQEHFPYFPLPRHPLPHIFLTKEYFGYMHAGHRRIIVSTALAEILLRYKVTKYNLLIPCRENLSDYLKTIEY